MAVQPHIRWMIKADMHQVLDIEQLCFSHPWNDADFLKVMRTRNNIGMVAVNHHDRVLGYMIYELHMRFIRLPNIAVHPLFYRHGIGSAMVEKLRGKLSVNRRRRLAT